MDPVVLLRQFFEARTMQVSYNLLTKDLTITKSFKDAFADEDVNEKRK